MSIPPPALPSAPPTAVDVVEDDASIAEERGYHALAKAVLVSVGATLYVLMRGTEPPAMEVARANGANGANVANGVSGPRERGAASVTSARELVSVPIVLIPPAPAPARP